MYRHHQQPRRHLPPSPSNEQTNNRITQQWHDNVAFSDAALRTQNRISNKVRVSVYGWLLRPPGDSSLQQWPKYVYQLPLVVCKIGFSICILSPGVCVCVRLHNVHSCGCGCGCFDSMQGPQSFAPKCKSNFEKLIPPPFCLLICMSPFDSINTSNSRHNLWLLKR